jgi:hypothetical protein
VLGVARLDVADSILEGALRRAVLELDDVVLGDELGGPGLEHRCHGYREGEGEESGQGEELHDGDLTVLCSRG